MEQRTLRLGDIVDDYCPRERRITNHAVVALVGDEIRQTRCATCDGEHVYKQARMPKRVAGSKDGDAVTDNGSGQLVPKAAAGKDEPAVESNGARSEKSDPADPQADPPEQSGDQPRDVDGWLAHRPLIRATLPRTEGEPPAPRPIPEFTMHRQAYGRPFRGHGHGRPVHNGQANGNGFDHERQGNHGNHGNQGSHGSPGNGQLRPAGGGGRRRRRRGGRPKQSH
jgi:hypothetical protein